MVRSCQIQSSQAVSNQVIRSGQVRFKTRIMASTPPPFPPPHPPSSPPHLPPPLPHHDDAPGAVLWLLLLLVTLKLRFQQSLVSTHWYRDRVLNVGVDVPAEPGK